MEELHVDPKFAAWFASLPGIGPDAIVDGAWHSLNGQDGETDLLLRVRDGNQRVALLIENKDRRYHVRGQRAQEAGRYERSKSPQLKRDPTGSFAAATTHEPTFRSRVGFPDSGRSFT